ncbi:MAG: 50S ribosomal protein L19 [Candidatus Moraniibacteriota bacterium]
MYQKLIAFNQELRKKVSLPELHSGDMIKVYRKIKEGEKERLQVFQGTVIAIKGGQSSSLMVTVRKVSFGIGVELVLPLLSPTISKIEILKSTKSRRSKLYFVRDKSAKVLSKKLREVGLKGKLSVVASEEASADDVESLAVEEELIEADEVAPEEAEVKA